MDYVVICILLPYFGGDFLVVVFKVALKFDLKLFSLKLEKIGGFLQEPTFVVELCLTV
jgi:hypothetical protein